MLKQLDEKFNKHIEEFSQDVSTATDNIFNHICSLTKDYFAEDLHYKFEIDCQGTCTMNEIIDEFLEPICVFKVDEGILCTYTEKVVERALEIFKDDKRFRIEKELNGFSMTIKAIY